MTLGAMIRGHIARLAGMTRYHIRRRRTMMYRTFLLSALCAVAGVTCSAQNKPTDPSKAAREVVQLFMDQRTMKCGEFTVTKWGGTQLDVLSKATVKLEEHELTEADRLNGIDWYGHACLIAAAHRMCMSTQGGSCNKWGEWVSPGKMEYAMYACPWQDRFTVKKRGTVWTVGADAPATFYIRIDPPAFTNILPTNLSCAEAQFSSAGGSAIQAESSASVAASSLDEQLIKHLRARDFSMVAELLAKGANPNTNDDYNAISVLGYAIESDRVDIARLVIGKGAKVNAMTSGDPHHPELFRARSLEMMELLIASGADPTAKGSDNRTLLHEYATNQPGMVAFLLSKGLDVNARDQWGRTPLAVAQEERAFLMKAKTEGWTKQITGFDERVIDNDAVIQLLVRQPASSGAVNAPATDSAAGKYVYQKDASSYIELRADGSASIHTGGRDITCTYTVQGGIVSVKGVFSGQAGTSSYRLSAEGMVSTNNGGVWEKEK
jgi:hypothetical protein